MKDSDLDRLCIPDECSPNPQAVEELKRIISSEPILREALNNILSVCNSHIDTGGWQIVPLPTIVHIATEALEKIGGQN